MKIFRRLLLENLPIKVLSLCLTVILFVLVREDRVKEYDLEIPVAMVGIPGDRIVTEGTPQAIRARLRGRWSDILAAVERRPTPYQVDMSSRNDGDMVVFDTEVIRRDLGEPRLEILTVSPPTVTIRLQVKAERRVKVRPDLVAKPERGFKLVREGIRVTPTEVVVLGTASSVQNIDELLTRPIDLAGLTTPLRTEIRLAVPPLPYLQAEPPIVQVEIPIVEEQSTVFFPDVAVEVRGCSHRMSCRIDPERVLVRLHGPLLQVERLRDADEPPVVFVDASAVSLEQGVYPDVAILVQAHDGITAVPSPDRVTLLVIPNPEATPAPGPATPPAGPDASPAGRDASEPTG